MARQAGKLDPRPLAGAADAVGIVEHRDAVEVARLAQQFAAPMDHRLHVLVAQFGGLFHAPFERLVVVPHEFHVHAQIDIAHRLASPKTEEC